MKFGKTMCKYINPIFSHHRKLEVGKMSLFLESSDCYNIFDLNEKRIGTFHKEQFTTLDEMLEIKLNQLGIN
jgi:hypothetical protein